MEYYTLYDIPVRLRIDADELKRRFYAKSRELHPDFHSMQDEATQNRIMDLAAFNNKAYLTLKDQALRIQYILTQRDLLAAEGENKVPQAFLMEMMDLNESLMEVKMDPSPELLTQVRNQISSFRTELDDSISHLFQKDDLDSLTEQDWTTLRDYHLKLRYLQRLSENLEEGS